MRVQWFWSALAALAFIVAMSASTVAETVERLEADIALERAKAGEITLLDIRTPEEWRATGVAEGATTLNLYDADFADQVRALRAAHPNRPIAMICARGGRSNFATSTLTELGLTGLIDVPEGMLGSAAGPGWIARGLPVTPGAE